MIDEVQRTFCGKTVFLTGHTGFKGSWMSLWLKRLGAKVVGYSIGVPSTPSNFALSDVSNAIDRHVIGDIRDANHIREAMHDCRPDIVYHFAAQTVVCTGYSSPRETFDVNVTGTASVLDAVAALKRPCTVVCVTSDKCYANDDQPHAFVETDPMGERDPYGASKGCTELVVKAYSHSFFPPSRFNEHRVAIASARAGNVIGGGDWTPYALAPDLVEAASKGQSIVLRNPQATRPWQHVLQTLSGYLLLAARLESHPQHYHGGWNFGPDVSEVTTVAEFAEEFFRAWGQGTWVDGSKPEQLHEAQSLMLSIAKAKAQLQWHPVWSTRKAIDRCVSWYKQYASGVDPSKVCVSQIDEFENDWLNFIPQ